MAYTYDDFLKSATETGLLKDFDSDDLVTAQTHPEYGLSLLSLKKDLGGATTDEQKLLISAAASQLKDSYHKKDVRGAQGNGYESLYIDRMDDLMDKTLNNGSFSYDKADDPTYSSYKKTYLREGDRAAANALAQASAASAGRASSYAVNAASQANDYYATQLSNVIPTLYENAYKKYLDEYSQNLSDLSALSTQDNTDYARYLDQLNLKYQSDRDAETDKQQEFANALAMYQLLSKTGQGIPAWITSALGLDAGTVGGAGTATGGGYWGGGGSFSELDDTEENEEKVTALQEALDRFNSGKFYTDDINLIVESGVLADNADQFKDVYPDADLSTEKGQRIVLADMMKGVLESGSTVPGTYNMGSGEIVSGDTYDANAGNYKDWNDYASELASTPGTTKDQVLADIKDAYQKGDLNLNDYMSLYNKYRDVPAASFGTTAAAAIASNSTATTDKSKAPAVGDAQDILSRLAGAVSQKLSSIRDTRTANQNSYLAALNNSGGSSAGAGLGGYGGHLGGSTDTSGKSSAGKTGGTTVNSNGFSHSSGSFASAPANSFLAALNNAAASVASTVSSWFK